MNSASRLADKRVLNNKETEIMGMDENTVAVGKDIDLETECGSGREHRGFQRSGRAVSAADDDVQLCYPGGADEAGSAQ